jgi:hypothetical protein
MGYSSTNTIINVKTISLLIAFYITRVFLAGFLKIVIKYCKIKVKIVKKLYNLASSGLFFSFIISLTFEGYFEFLITSWLNLKHPGFSTNREILSCIISICLSFCSLIFVPISSIYVVKQDKEKLESHKFEQTWGEFYEDCKIDTYARRLFKMTHVLKVLIFVISSITLKDSLVLQIQIIFCVNLIQIIYLGLN